MAGEAIGKAVQGLTKAVKAIGKILFDNPIAKGIRGGTSALVGIPVAVATTMVLTSFYAMSKAMVYSHQHFKNVWGIGKVKVDDPALVAISDFFWDAIGKTWTEFGIYGYLKSAELFKEHAAKMQDDLGFGNASDNSDDIDNLVVLQGENAMQKNTEEKIKKQTKKILYSLPLSEEEKEEQHAEFEKWLEWIHADNAPQNESDFSNKAKLTEWLEEAPESVIKLFSMHNELLDPLEQILTPESGEKEAAMNKLIEESNKILPRSFPQSPLNHQKVLPKQITVGGKNNY